MDPGAIIRAEREKRKWSQKDLADRVGVSQVAIMKIERGVTKKSKHFPKIAQVLGIPLMELDSSLSQLIFTKPQQISRLREVAAISVAQPGRLLGKNDLPVFSIGQAAEGVPVLSERPFRFVGRPQNLEGIADAFAVLIVGNTMAREYREGDIAYVDPYTPPRAGDACLFQNTRGGMLEATIRYLDKPPDHSDTHWIVSQSNPQKHGTLKKADWTRCLVLVGKQSGR